MIGSFKISRIVAAVCVVGGIAAIAIIRHNINAKKSEVTLK